MSWIKDLFNVDKPIIAMCHLHALPGDPDYDPEAGMEWVVERARADLLALQEGGVDAVMFSNERSLPYLTKVEPITTVAMARVIGELYDDIQVPWGVNVLWDPTASIDLAVATGAQFVREIFTGVYGSDYGLWNTNAGEVIRHRNRIHGENVRLLFNIVPESAAYLGDRDIESIARSTVFNCRPDALCVSGLTAGSETDASILKRVKDVVPDTPVFANTGVKLSNVAEQLAIADGTVTGSTFKRDGYIWNEVDVKRVREFMDRVKEIRAAIAR
ncbi:MAG TPA: BtpA/SgcQ family protein [Aggregatilineales bacterium]|nr:BtpA/SgcQ family protein [Chloroflexota bacterium]HOA24432.1 BtpA/SgcQ family protein [Aggregatilineales bacterium]HPV06234.1 BtpA/SgcQ family protein [Aggregatilineales bacterium]HQA66876.1 BtpA/SgcQ family protein [Aggregatilineales bacterium]HQE17471.1 BtpA/SgcQ family protein [Aggregatilineales bacterium]